MDIIKVNGLTKTYGSLTAVNNISFSVHKGELLGFLGVNGAGKSTTINMLSTLIKPDNGTAELCGYALGEKNAEIRRRIGIVYQNNSLDRLLTVRENLLCRGILHGADRVQAKKRLQELSSIFSLDELLKKPYNTLSGGQKRRCEIAAALMHTPEILFLDEPTTGLDPATRKEVWETIDALRKSTEMTVFLTTHYMEEAAQAGRIIIISKGNIIAEGTPNELKTQYAADTLRIYCKSEKIQKVQKLIRNSEITDNGLTVAVSSTMEALPILEKVRDLIDGFEVIQGTMDDVFLAATGEEIKEGK